jgi:hypothetical protein
MVAGANFTKWALVAVVLVVLGAVAPSSGSGIKLPFRFPQDPIFTFMPAGPEGEYRFRLSANATVCVGNMVYGAKQIFSYSYWVKTSYTGCEPSCEARVINMFNGDIPDNVPISLPTEDCDWTEVVANLSARNDFKHGRENKYALAFCCEADDDEPEFFFRKTNHVSRGASQPKFDTLVECEDYDCEVEREEEPLHMTVDYQSGRRRGEPKHLRNRVQLVPTLVPVPNKRSKKN